MFWKFLHLGKFIPRNIHPFVCLFVCFAWPAGHTLLWHSGFPGNLTLSGCSLDGPSLYRCTRWHVLLRRLYCLWEQTGFRVNFWPLDKRLLTQVLYVRIVEVCPLLQHVSFFLRCCYGPSCRILQRIARPHGCCLTSRAREAVSFSLDATWSDWAISERQRLCQN